MRLRKTCLVTCFLDCCREFTFDASEVITGPARSGNDELGQYLTLFACEPNGYAYDGKGKHGFFTEVLLKYLAMLNLELSELVRLVTKEVVDRLGLKQMPHKESVLWDLWCLFTKQKYTLRPRSIDFVHENLHAGAEAKELRGPVSPFCRRRVRYGRGECACQDYESAVSSPLKRAPTAHPRGLQGTHESETAMDPISFKQQVP